MLRIYDAEPLATWIWEKYTTGLPEGEQDNFLYCSIIQEAPVRQIREIRSGNNHITDQMDQFPLWMENIKS